ncbi:hypothetical protein D3C81_752300 [compost metagenome]
MSDTRSNLAAMLNRQFKGEFLRAVLGAQLCDSLRIYDGMRLTSETLTILIEKVCETEHLDFSHVLTVTEMRHKRGSVKSIDQLPNLRLTLGNPNSYTYFLVAPARLYEWAEYDDAIRNLYRVIAPVIFKERGNPLGKPDLDRLNQTLNFVCPVFWFEYNFVTGRFSMRTPTGVIIRRIKRSQYPVFSHEPKLVIQIGTLNHYALIQHSDPKGIDVGFWLNPRENDVPPRLEHDMVKHMASVGWDADVRIATNESMMKGCIEEWADDLSVGAGKTLKITLDPRDPDAPGTVTAIAAAYADAHKPEQQ